VVPVPEQLKEATSATVPRLRIAPSLGIADVVAPRYRLSQGAREIISLEMPKEVNPAGEVRRGNGLTGKASGRFSAGSVVAHAGDGLQRLSPSLNCATLPAFSLFIGGER
jgi:hypothetical protein